MELVGQLQQLLAVYVQVQVASRSRQRKVGEGQRLFPGHCPGDCGVLVHQSDEPTHRPPAAPPVPCNDCDHTGGFFTLRGTVLFELREYAHGVFPAVLDEVHLSDRAGAVGGELRQAWSTPRSSRSCSGGVVGPTRSSG